MLHIILKPMLDPQKVSDGMALFNKAGWLLALLGTFLSSLLFFKNVEWRLQIVSCLKYAVVVPLGMLVWCMSFLSILSIFTTGWLIFTFVVAGIMYAIGIRSAPVLIGVFIALFWGQASVGLEILVFLIMHLIFVNIGGRMLQKSIGTIPYLEQQLKPWQINILRKYDIY